MQHKINTNTNVCHYVVITIDLFHIPGLANVCLITSSMTIVRAKIDTAIPRKRKGQCTQHDKVSLRCSRVVFFDGGMVFGGFRGISRIKLFELRGLTFFFFENYDIFMNTDYNVRNDIFICIFTLNALN